MQIDEEAMEAAVLAAHDMIFASTDLDENGSERLAKRLVKRVLEEAFPDATLPETEEGEGEDPEDEEPEEDDEP